MSLSPDDIAELSRLFDASEVVDVAERESWLATLAPDRRHLVPMLRQMLTTKPSDNDLWPLPTLALDVDALPGTDKQIGRFRLVREIGDGGMGSVWLAAAWL